MPPWVILGLVGALACRRMLGLLSLSEEVAAGMGVRIVFWKPAPLFCAVLPVAGIVPVAGPAAFVGLASPHIARLLRPPTPGWTLLPGAAIGGLMVISADVVGRGIAAPRESPVGILTAAFGSPVFIYLVLRRGERLAETA
jgi:iron complex transport system permease protein